jgi:hypothetical protein
VLVCFTLFKRRKERKERKNEEEENEGGRKGGRKRKNITDRTNHLHPAETSLFI